MAAAQSRPGFRRGAVEPAGGARIDDLLPAGREVVDEGASVADHCRVEPRREMALWRARHRHVERPPLGLPFGQAAVEDRDIVVAEEAQHPPGAPGR
jgi:hypothetical protein